jgi:hypothetical protein
VEEGQFSVDAEAPDFVFRLVGEEDVAVAVGGGAFCELETGGDFFEAGAGGD